MTYSSHVLEELGYDHSLNAGLQGRHHRLGFGVAGREEGYDTKHFGGYLPG